MGKNERKDSEWIVEVEKSLGKESRPDTSQCGLIHTVPKSLLHTSDKVFYHPHVISFGPYHFRKEDVRNDDIELLKSEVATKMHLKIIGKGRTEGLKSVVEKFKGKAKQDRIKKSYAKDIKLCSEEVLAWMMVRDACFVLEVLDRFGEGEDKAKGSEDAAEMSTLIDGILSRNRHHPLLTEIVKDMLKMENQLPFWVLKEIRNEYSAESNDDVWLESALKKLSPIEVAERPCRKNEKESHILLMLHDYTAYRQATENSITLKEEISYMGFLFAAGYIVDCMLDFESRRCMKLLLKLLGCVIILLVLSPVLVILFIWGIIFSIWYFTKKCILSEVEEKEEHVPTVEELKRLGVKFKNSDGQKKIGVGDIKFKESDSKLYLPKINIDNRSEVILRNLITLEFFSEDEQKPITRYALLMNDLINTSGDVAILRREGIITSKLGSDDEIAQLWNSMVTATEMPRYNSIDEACESINHYRKKWWKVLWAQFIMVHCSKPWLFLSLLAGVTLLLLTLTQVVCVFKSCQLK